MKLKQGIIDYINKLSLSDVHADNFKMLNNLSKLIDDLDCSDSFDVCYYIEKNHHNVFLIVEDVVSNNLEQIKNDVSKLSSSLTFISFIEVYCTENGISIYDENLSDNVDVHDYYYNMIKEIPVLSRDEEIELFKDFESDDLSIKNKARKKLIHSNLRLVVSIAYKYNYKLPFDDLVQEGNIGLMEAIDHFDYRRGFRFSTCAFYWIRKCIIRAIRKKAYNVTLPYNFHDKMSKYRKAIDILNNNNISTPTYEEIINNSGLTYDEIKAIELNLFDTVSLDEIVRDDGDTDLHNYVSDQNSNVENIIDKAELTITLDYIFKKMGFSEQQIDILSMRYGITGEPKTLEAIGEKYGITRERVRQIISRLLVLIKSNEECLRILSQYMPNSNECFERTYIKRRRSKK